MQVSLGHNDEFFAFDQYDRISHLNTELRDSACSINHKSRKMTMTDPKDETIIRRKSHTISSSYMLTEDDNRSISTQRQQVQRKKLRPRSIAIAGMLSLAASQEKKKNVEAQASKARASLLDGKQRLPLPVRRPTYSDMGVQTDRVEDQRPDVDNVSLREYVAEEANSPASQVFSLSPLFSTSALRRVDSSLSFSSSLSSSSRNPVSMGAMSRFFRERDYRLGDALIRGPAMGIGAH